LLDIKYYSLSAVTPTVGSEGGQVAEYTKLTVAEWNHWEVLLHTNDQRYLGRLVVVLKRPCSDLALLERNELVEWHQAVEVLQRALRKAFDATMFNWCCLMNDAYQEENPQPQVHWHFRPRYDHPVEFAGEMFQDPNFGHHYLRDKENNRKLRKETLEELAEKERNSRGAC
jgi:diadenosine tetraphosphate (Ap4A) HIT family hydrolase